jgi:alkylation response protein AidB-like acyl-CoA dehydrogenase
MTLNAFSDSAVQIVAKRVLGPEAYERARPRLERVGALALGPVAEWAAIADKQSPVLVNFDRTGERVDRLVFHPAYREMEKVFYGEGCVAASYDPKFAPEHGGAPHSLGLLIGYLLAQGEGGLFCPVCMTDGAARLLVKFDKQGQMRDRLVPRLAATDIDKLYTGAMFLTEKQGGSDVGMNETVARKDGAGWRLTGQKWFCSNAGADVIMALGRPEGAPPGTPGLGLYVMPRLTDDGKPNRYRMDRLKDKLGVRSMPTAEITLEGAFAWELGGPGEGFKQMTEMLNLSRLYNAVTSMAILARALHEARLWASDRVAFGKKLVEHEMLKDQLEAWEAEKQGGLAMVFEATRLMDRADAKKATDDEKNLLRVLLPLAKLHTAKQAVRGTSECLEVLGGNGYVEDWPLARMLRDAQVLPIWEGASNVMALDVLRACRKGGEEALDKLMGKKSGILAAGPTPKLRLACQEAARFAQAALVERMGLSPVAASHLREVPWGRYL